MESPVTEVLPLASLSAHVDYVLLEDISIEYPAKCNLHKDTVVRIVDVTKGIYIRVPNSNITVQVRIEALAVWKRD